MNKFTFKIVGLFAIQCLICSISKAEFQSIKGFSYKICSEVSCVELRSEEAGLSDYASIYAFPGKLELRIHKATGDKALKEVIYAKGGYLDIDDNQIGLREVNGEKSVELLYDLMTAKKRYFEKEVVR